MILKLNLKLEIRKKCVMTRVVCVFWILKQIVLRQTDTSFEEGDREIWSQVEPGKKGGVREGVLNFSSYLLLT